MDTVKQSVAGIIGSVLLAGCLNQSNVFDSTADVQTEDEDQDGQTAALWPTTPLPDPAAPTDLDQHADGTTMLALGETRPETGRRPIDVRPSPSTPTAAPRGAPC